VLAEVRSGSSVKDVAERHSLSPSLLYRWMQSPSEVRKGRAPVFARLAVSRVIDSALVVHVGRATIRVEKGFDAELLRDVVAALDGAR
jgi:transposase-like protein